MASERCESSLGGAVTAEEADVLGRSRKKVRVGDAVVSNDRAVVPRVEDWMSDDDDILMEEGKSPLPMIEKGPPMGGAKSPAKSPTKSYKAACADNMLVEVQEEDEGEWWKGDGWKSWVIVEKTEKGTNIVVLPEYQQKLARKWATSLIVRLLGQMVREDYLGNKLKQLWGRRGEVETLEIGFGFFLVRLSSKEDYEFTLTEEGPWLILDHYLAIQQWKPDFDPDATEVSKIAAWVRILKLPVDYYDEGILHVVGGQIDRVIKVDRTTLQHAKGRFACLCIEIDLNLPLLPVIFINGKEKKIVYEGLHLICFSWASMGMTWRCSSSSQLVTQARSGVQGTPEVNETVQSLGLLGAEKTKSTEYGE